MNEHRAGLYLVGKFSNADEIGRINQKIARARNPRSVLDLGSAIVSGFFGDNERYRDELVRENKFRLRRIVLGITSETDLSDYELLMSGLMSRDEVTSEIGLMKFDSEKSSRAIVKNFASKCGGTFVPPTGYARVYGATFYCSPEFVAQAFMNEFS